MKKGIWLLPTRQRIEKLQAALDSMIATGISTPGLILVQAQELAESVLHYSRLRLPPNWEVVGVAGDGAMGKSQEAFETGLCGDAEWVGLLQDDFAFETPFWDQRLIGALNGYNMISANDLWRAPKHHGSALVYSRELIDAIGYMAPPGMKHLFHDTLWEYLGARTGCLQYAMDVMIPHRHALLNGNGMDSTSDTQEAFWRGDEAIYNRWMHEECPKAVNRIFALMERHGVKIERPDLKGISIFLCSPAGDGTYDRTYVKSLLKIQDAVKAAGGDIDWGEMPYCSDVSLARNRLIGSFYQSNHTHMLMVDSDMGYNPEDALRLVMSGYDVVGGAGPKKEYPLRFCLDASNEMGQPLGGEYNAATGALEVSHIGTGFLMIRRAVVDKMVAAYPELAFDVGHGKTEYALFDPLITKARLRKSDDYAFCHRWKAIGGKIYALPAIRLKHTGSHTFEGSLLEAMQAMGPIEPETTVQV